MMKDEDDKLKYLNTQAIALLRQNNLQEAMQMFRQMMALDPDNFDALQGMGFVTVRMGNVEEALGFFTRACAVRPNNYLAHYHLGKVLHESRRHQDALASYDQAIALQPDHAEIHYSRGITLFHMNRLDDSVSSFDQAIALKPGLAEAWNNRGNVLRELKRYEDALSSYDQAISLRPGHADDWNNRGGALKELKRFDDAMSSFDHAITLDPKNPRAQFSKAILKLSLGDYEQGWPLYEWRWQAMGLKYSASKFKQPLWLGDKSLEGKTILIYEEQGLGDFIQFVRYVPLVEALGARVILASLASLATLLRSLNGSFELITPGDPFPAFDLHCPVMSLPLAFKTTVETIPAAIPYLAADPQKQAEVCRRLAPKNRLRVGLVWLSGWAGKQNDRSRSIALRTLEPLLCLDFEFHSLQKEVRPEDEIVLKDYPQIHTHHDELNDFADTAAWVAAMDVVITIDTSVAHLAGALGQTTWILLPYTPDWRWLMERSDSPWYPTVRLFRQTQPGDWASVIARVQSQLIGLTSARNPG